MSNSILLPERWLPVPGYEGAYEVSDLGNVRSVDRWVRHYSAGWGRRRGRLLKQTPGPDGRLTVKLSVRSVTRTHLVHQLVLKAFVGPRPPGMFGCHNDGDHTSNLLGNLRWDTPRSNSLDMLIHGTNHARNRTHCPRQHPLAEPNLVASRLRDGHRVCLACARGKAYVWRHRDLDFNEVADRYYAEIMRNAA